MSSIESETRKRILEATWNLMEKQQGQGVRMSDIATAAGVSRQALYLHFASRTDLLVETTRYGDEVRGIEERLQRCRTAGNGVKVLEAYIDFWGKYILEIYGIARALLAARETDEAAAAAWNDRMVALKDCCLFTITALEQEGLLAAGWTISEGTELLLTLLSIQNWIQLTVESGWSIEQYVARIQEVARSTLVYNPLLDNNHI